MWFIMGKVYVCEYFHIHTLALVRVMTIDYVQVQYRTL